MRSIAPGFTSVWGAGVSLLWLAFLWLAAWPLDSTAQIVSGVVRDAATHSPIQDVQVSQWHDGKMLMRTVTDASGRFELELEDAGNAALRFERLGYRSHTLPVQVGALSPEPIDVELVADPLLVSGIDVEVKRESERFRLSSYFTWTEDGLYRNGETHLGCHLMVLDSVVIRDPDLYRPEVLETYWPASQFMDTEWGIRASYNHVGRPNVAGLAENEPRLQREADPCTPAVFIQAWDPYYRRAKTSAHPPEARYPERLPPDPDAPGFELVVRVEVAFAWSADLPDPDADIPAAVGPNGMLAVAEPGRGVVRVFGLDGREVERWNLDETPASFGSVSHIGWLADTLWAADAREGRVARLPPDEDSPHVREPRGPQLVLGEVEGPPYEGEDPDLGVPRPLAGGRWLSVQLTSPEPYPTRMKNEPARRALLVLNAELRLERVLETLRPGPWRIDVKEPGAPVDPFRDHPLYAVGPDGTHVTVVERSLQHAVWMNIYTVTRVTIDGDTLFRVERPPPLIRVSDETRAAVAEDLAGHPVMAEALPFDDARRALVEALLYQAPFHPPISDIVVGRDGTTWLRWPDVRDGPVRWDVLDAEGRPLRTLYCDRRLRILGATAGDVWGLVTDDERKPRLIHYEIEPRP